MTDTNLPAVYEQGLVNIHFPTAKDSCPGYLSPVNHDSKFGLVVLQEWWGLNVSITKTANEFAAEGFRALVPDLFRGKVAKNSSEANHLLEGLDWVQAVEDIRSATKYLKSEGCTKVGVVGFCMGGALVLASSFQVAEMDAGACFYGIPGLDGDKADKIKIPLICFFGGKDGHKGFSDPPTVDKLEELFREHKVLAEFVRYPEADHAFMNRDRPSVYNPELAEESRTRTAAFFKKHFA